MPGIILDQVTADDAELARIIRVAAGLEFDGNPVWHFQRVPSQPTGSVAYEPRGRTFEWASQLVAEKVYTADRNLAGELRAVGAFTELAPAYEFTPGLPSSPNPSNPPGPSTPTYFPTLPSGQLGLPTTDAYAASRVPSSTWEPRPDNTTANHRTPSGAVPWSNSSNQTYWTKWIAKRSHVTGNYTGTTDQIIRWAACKWGIDEDTLRAVAVQESDWHQNAQGDFANGSYHSFGIMQVRDTGADGSPDWGGYPDTLNETALNVDFYAAVIRSTFDGDFYDGGPWLYGGQTIAQVIAAHDADYAFWGCIGAWFSGNWYDSGAQSYITSVKAKLAARTWTTY